jgi:hypothetical protein
VARLKMKDRADVLAAREQFRSDIEHKLYGTQDAASAVRKIDVAEINSTASFQTVLMAPKFDRSVIRCAPGWRLRPAS